jgi:hypothetical protein
VFPVFSLINDFNPAHGLPPSGFYPYTPANYLAPEPCGAIHHLARFWWRQGAIAPSQNNKALLLVSWDAQSVIELWPIRIGQHPRLNAIEALSPMVQGAHIQGVSIAADNGSPRLHGVIVSRVDSAVVAVDKRNVPHIQPVSHGPIYKLVLKTKGTHTFKSGSMGSKIFIVTIIVVTPDPVTGWIASGLP